MRMISLRQNTCSLGVNRVPIDYQRFQIGNLHQLKTTSANRCQGLSRKVSQFSFHLSLRHTNSFCDGDQKQRGHAMRDLERRSHEERGLCFDLNAQPRSLRPMQIVALGFFPQELRNGFEPEQNLLQALSFDQKLTAHLLDGRRVQDAFHALAHAPPSPLREVLPGDAMGL
jgi:hypothetical protein